MGDTYTGKVVKTTDFGAFVELKKGTDGLLHVSNVGPGRVNHIEDVLARGDVLDVLVQEVDKARGRIGLKLVQKHENGGFVSPEELVERAKDAPPREPREERPRGGPRPRPWRPSPRAPGLAATSGHRRHRGTLGPASRFAEPGPSSFTLPIVRLVRDPPAEPAAHRRCGHAAAVCARATAPPSSRRWSTRSSAAG